MDDAPRDQRPVDLDDPEDVQRALDLLEVDEPEAYQLAVAAHRAVSEGHPRCPAWPDPVVLRFCADDERTVDWATTKPLCMAREMHERGARWLGMGED